MQRVCFQLQVRPQRLAEYVDRHQAVWPEMLAALASTGWHNYSLFLGEDGLLIGYFETPSLEQAIAGMAATDVDARWQAEMAEYFVGRTDAGFPQLREVFNLADQLENLPAQPPAPEQALDTAQTLPQTLHSNETSD